MKMWLYDTDFLDQRLHVNYPRWMNSPAQVQCFAIYIPEHVPTEAKFTVALHMIDIFYERIIKPYRNIRIVQSVRDMESLELQEKGALLTLEGLDCIGYELFKLRTLIQLGVKMIGMSWNNPNLAVDGIGEQRGCGLTDLGRKVIELANQTKTWIDLAHISEQGFDEAVELADHIIVSHANSRVVMPHPRNLTDRQIQAIVAKDGLVGLTFVRDFVADKSVVTINDLFEHIHYFLQLGCENHLVFGSDFDGTDHLIDRVQSIEDYHFLQGKMRQTFPKGVNKKILFQNFLAHFPN
ncbi:membrane dipeptidase [Gracilibacillus caseinilyticus]|uniref:Membrane dipeptidase n=1 Tax=Gracilibacillus caseinilyticus TaxID=2932256 RepID=A0ABY4EU00_9BACI|nr:membrane dipeptidase [Gracilibacillus caseinilyticus]UOQ47805.1 membrane dipeptidase [Gracilibacillus caseinilyticus]